MSLCLVASSISPCLRVSVAKKGNALIFDQYTKHPSCLWAFVASSISPCLRVSVAKKGNALIFDQYTKHPSCLCAFVATLHFSVPPSLRGKKEKPSQAGERLFKQDPDSLGRRTKNWCLLSNFNHLRRQYVTVFYLFFAIT